MGDEDALQFDAEQDFVAKLVKDPRRRLSIYANTTAGNDSDDDTIGDAECTFIVPVDLHEWEAKLTAFLQRHEASTAAFDLERYGSNLVANFNASGNSTGKMADVFLARKSSSEMCRQFLSVLDLANKKVVGFEEGEKDTGLTSRDFEHLGLKLQK